MDRGTDTHDDAKSLFTVLQKCLKTENNTRMNGWSYDTMEKEKQ
jgi:hypothetical protein